MSASHHASIPAWTWAVPLVASTLLGLKFAHVAAADAAYVLILAGVLLGATVFVAVHHAEILALKLGEPFGSIPLAVAVTVIEVGLIVSNMPSGAEGNDRLARHGVHRCNDRLERRCRALPRPRRGEAFRADLPIAGRFLRPGGARDAGDAGPDPAELRGGRIGPSFSILQLEGVDLMSLVLWGVLVFVQTVKHLDYFLDAPGSDDSSEGAHEVPGGRTTLLSLIFLIVSLAAVVLLANTLSYPVDAAIAAAGLPKAFVGVVIAVIVLVPEGLAAVNSALRNRLQNGINLALGSAIASIGLRIPAVALVSLMLNRQIALGVSQTDMTLLILTLYISALTFGTGRTTVLQGAVHLGIFAAFLLVSAVP